MSYPKFFVGKRGDIMETAAKHLPKGSNPIIGKEVLIGLLSLTLGGYNLLQQFGLIEFRIEAPFIMGNILLVLGGLFLLLQAYKLWRHEYHIKSLF